MTWKPIALILRLTFGGFFAAPNAHSEQDRFSDAASVVRDNRSNLAIGRAMELCEAAAERGRLDVLSMALRSEGPVHKYVLGAKVFGKLNPTQKATILADVLADDALWPSAQEVLNGIGPTEKQMRQFSLVGIAARILGGNQKHSEYLDATERHALVEQLHRFALSPNLPSAAAPLPLQQESPPVMQPTMATPATPTTSIRPRLPSAPSPAVRTTAASTSDGVTPKWTWVAAGLVILLLTLTLVLKRRLKS